MTFKAHYQIESSWQRLRFNLFSGMVTTPLYTRVINTDINVISRSGDTGIQHDISVRVDCLSAEMLF